MRKHQFWSDYFSRVRARLKAGQREYGDESLEHRPIDQVIGELKEELEDLAGWGAIIHHRLTRMQDRLMQLTSQDHRNS